MKFKFDRAKLHPLLSRACAVSLAILLSACATQPATMTDPERDPWEPVPGLPYIPVW